MLRAAPAPAEEAGIIRGRAVTDDGRGVSAMRVICESGSASSRDITGADGRFEMVVPLGRYQVWLDGRFAPIEPRVVEVVPGRPVELQWVVRTFSCSKEDVDIASRRWLVRRSQSVPELAAVGAPRMDAGPQLVRVIVAACLGDPELDRRKLLDALGWRAAGRAGREKLAAAWIADVVLAFEEHEPPAATTVDSGRVAVDLWRTRWKGDVLVKRAGREHVRWWIAPDGELIGPQILAVDESKR